MTITQAIALGQQTALALGLQLKNGKYATSWGDKTPEGLGRMIDILVKENNVIFEY